MANQYGLLISYPPKTLKQKQTFLYFLGGGSKNKELKTRKPFGPLPHMYTNACKQGCVHTLNTTSVCNGALRSHFVKILLQRHAITQELCLTCFYLKLTSKSQSPLHSELPFPFSVLRQTENNIYLVTNVYPYKHLSATNSAQCSTHIRQI